MEASAASNVPTMRASVSTNTGSTSNKVQKLTKNSTASSKSSAKAVYGCTCFVCEAPPQNPLLAPSTLVQPQEPANAEHDYVMQKMDDLQQSLVDLMSKIKETSQTIEDSDDKNTINNGAQLLTDMLLNDRATTELTIELLTNISKIKNKKTIQIFAQDIRVWTKLVDLLPYSDIRVKGVACHAISKLAKDKQTIVDNPLLLESMLKRLVGCLKSDHNTIKLLACNAISKLGFNNEQILQNIVDTKEMLNQLVVCLDQSNDQLKKTAGILIANLLTAPKINEDLVKIDTIFEKFKTLLTQENTKQTINALYVIYNLANKYSSIRQQIINTPEILNKLTACLFDENKEVRQFALSVLSKLVLNEKVYHKKLATPDRIFEGLKYCLEKAKLEKRHSECLKVINIISNIISQNPSHTLAITNTDGMLYQLASCDEVDNRDVKDSAFKLIASSLAYHPNSDFIQQIVDKMEVREALLAYRNSINDNASHIVKIIDRLLAPG